MEKSIINLDLYSFIPYAIEAFTHVYGKEYKELTTNNLNHTLITTYQDVEGLDSYIFHLTSCKNRELSIEFLRRIGYDVEKYRSGNYTEDLPKEIEEIIKTFLYYPYNTFKEYNQDSLAFLAFDEDKNNDSEKKKNQKIKIINLLRSPSTEPITKETLKVFTETAEYQEILKKINRIKEIYYELKEEYDEWAQILEPYNKYVEEENERQKVILNNGKKSAFRAIFSSLPAPVIEQIKDKSESEKEEAVLGCLDISSSFFIEYFSQKQMDKLASKDIDPNDKFWIVYWQAQYLKNLGITFPETVNLKCETDEDITNYLNFISQEEVQKYIPNEEIINYIKTIREKNYNNSLETYYKTRQDFQDIMKMFANNQGNIDYFLNIFRKKLVCISGNGGRAENNEFIRIMCFTVRNGDCDKLFHNFLHEAGHAIDQNENGTGFEPLVDYTENGQKNPYDSNHRKYEKFNETVNDIFTIEALDYLTSKGIYLIQPYEFTCLDTSDHNTHSITKDLLKPLIQRFRSQVIKAKVNSRPEYLTRYIGLDNYEELNDIVNKVDYLCRNGLESKMQNDPDNMMILEYYAALERLSEVYNKIDEYYNQTLFMSEPNEGSHKSL